MKLIKKDLGEVIIEDGMERRERWKGKVCGATPYSCVVGAV